MKNALKIYISLSLVMCLTVRTFPICPSILEKVMFMELTSKCCIIVKALQNGKHNL